MSKIKEILTKIVDFFKAIMNGYFKLCGYVVFGFEWLIKLIWEFLKYVSVLVYNYVLKYVVFALVWFYQNVVVVLINFIYRILLKPIGKALQFIHTKVPPFTWVHKYVYYPIYSATLKPLFERRRNGKRGLSMEMKKALTGYGFISPFILGLITLVFYPLGLIIYMSFNRVGQYQQTTTYEWVGWQNYHRILRVDLDFVLEAQDFIVRVLLFTPVIITLAIVIAMLLNQNIKGKGIFRMIFFLPIIILNGELLTNMSEYGGMDINLSFFVLDLITTIVPEFAVDLFIELFGIIIEILWYTGVPILIFLAMLQKVDRSLYEAASIDGANAWSRFWKITLPIISPAITVSIIFIVVFLGNFDGNLINGLISQSRFEGGQGEGYSSAMALIYTSIQLMAIFVLLFISSKQIRHTILGKNRKKKLIPKSQQLKMSKKGA